MKKGDTVKLKSRFEGHPDKKEKEKRFSELAEIMARKNKIRASVLYGNQ